MALRVYNTLTRQKEEFKTVQPGRVGMYVCGPTVYKPSHVGHMVGPVIFDTVRRYLQYVGYEVDFVQNTPFGAGATEEAKKAALAAIDGLKAKKPIYVGPLKDNKTGKVVIDKTYDNLDPYLDKMSADLGPHATKIKDMIRTIT